MKRNILILGVVAVCIVLLVASAVLTFRHRRQMEAAQPVHVELGQPDVAADKAAAAKAGQSDAMPDGSQDFRGKPAPDFTLKSLEGKTVSLKDYRGKGVLVNFWATWCAPCKIEIPWFLKLHDQYSAQGFEILGVTAEDIPADEVAKSARGLGINYPVLLRGDTIGDKWGGLDGLPTSFYINAQGVIVDQTVGLYSRDEVEAKIKKILPGNAAAVRTMAGLR